MRIVTKNGYISSYPSHAHLLILHFSWPIWADLTKVTLEIQCNDVIIQNIPMSLYCSTSNLPYVKNMAPYLF